MELGEALFRDIAGRSSRSEITNFDDALDYLTAAFGSASAAARAIGEPPSTVRHWASGKRSPKGDRAANVTRIVQQLERNARMSAKREARLRLPGKLGQAIECEIAVSAAEERTLDISSYLDEGVEDALVDAYLAGASPEELADTFHSHIGGSAFYEDVFEPGGGQYSTDITDLGWR